MPRTIHQRLYTAGQTRELDRLAVAGGIAGFDLMQRAGTVLLRVVQERWPGARELLIFTGPGNNGGDGLVLAALAKQCGLAVEVHALAPVEKLKGEAGSARDLAVRHEVAIEEATPDGIAEALQRRCQRGGAPGCVVVDAMLGTGIRGEVRPPYREAIEQINRSTLPVLAVDVPSGLDSDTGCIAGVAISAAVTVSFIGLNRGLFTADGPDQRGELVFDRLAVPGDLYEQASVWPPSAWRLTVQTVLPWLPSRTLATHKGDCGRVVVAGGDCGYGGAALLCAEAAARSGAGTVCLLTRSEHVAPSLSRRPEVMVRGLDEASLQPGDLLPAMLPALQSATALVAGPGLGQSEWSVAVLRQLIQWQRDNGLPLVLDADALVLLGRAGELSLPEPLPDLTVLTPHPGEAARLLACSVADVQADRFAAAQALQQRWGGVALLKGVGTVVCYPQDGGVAMAGGPAAIGMDICTEGNPGMATGGMGDVLAGLAGGLLAQRMPLDRAVRAAVAIHGESADLAAGEGGERGMLASDLMPFIHRLVSQQRRQA
ncbi:MAG: NAD(P)H-hydrate dehydratase [Pseudohongiellaceae bacterium]